MPAASPTAGRRSRSADPIPGTSQLDAMLIAAANDPDVDPMVRDWFAAFLRAEPSAERPQRVKTISRRKQAQK